MISPENGNLESIEDNFQQIRKTASNILTFLIDKPANMLNINDLQKFDKTKNKKLANRHIRF